MAYSNVVSRPAATAWGAVLGGWVATIGASVIFAPMVAGLLAVPGTPVGDIAVAVPVVPEAEPGGRGIFLDRDREHVARVGTGSVLAQGRPEPLVSFPAHRRHPVIVRDAVD